MEDPQAPSEVPGFTFKKRGNKSKSIIRKREPTPPQASDSDSGFSSDEEEGRQIKKRKKNLAVNASTTNATVRRTAEDEPSNTGIAVIRPTNADDATKTSNWFDEEEGNKINESKRHLDGEEENTTLDGKYKGAANYQSFIKKNPDRTTKQVGPLKQSANVRTITVTDFAPDVCKDYKQTGFCGFGDSCKFLHAREDYKQGWQLDRDWEIDTKGKKVQGKTVASANRDAATQEGDEDEKMLESIPFACIICKKPYTNPIVTKCNHYFCEACALKRYKKNPSCAACGTSTGGVFNTATKLTKLLERKRERMRQREERAQENGEATNASES